MPAPTFRAITSTGSAADDTSVVLTTPAGVQAGDLLLAFFATDASTTVTDPANWVLLRTDVTGALRCRLCYKIAGPAEPATYTWTLGAAAGHAGIMAAYYNVDPSNPVNPIGEQANASSPTVSAPAITTGSDNFARIALFAQPATTFYGAFSIFGASLLAETRTTGGSAASAVLYDASLFTSGAGVLSAVTAVAATAISIGYQLALNPAVAVSVVGIPRASPGVTADYQVWLRAPTGELLKVLDDFSTLHWTRVSNSPGALTLTLPDRWDSKRNQYLFDLFKLDSRIEVWRAFNGRTPYLEGETQYFVRRRRRILTEQNERLITLEALDAIQLLDRRYVLYGGDALYAGGGSPPASVTQSSTAAPADDTMKVLMRQNFGASATPTTRNLSVYLSVAANLSLGTGLAKQFGYRKVFDVCKELAAAAAQAGAYLAFDVVWISSSNPQLEFRTYTVARGVDHRFPSGLNPVLLDPDMGNALSIELGLDDTNAVNYVFVGGQGDGALRLTDTRQDLVRIGLSPFNLIEAFKDSRSSDTLAAMDADGDMVLRANRSRRIFQIKTNQIPGALYGLHYKYGDMVSVNFRNTLLQCRIDGTAGHVEGGKELIDLTARADELLE